MTKITKTSTVEWDEATRYWLSAVSYQLLGVRFAHFFDYE